MRKLDIASSTTLKLPDSLKARIVALADAAGRTPHAFMVETLKAHVRTEKNRRTLAALGLKEGIFYETGIPVSGKGEAADRERYKKQLDLKKKPD